jgi:hypothetical protein
VDPATGNKTARLKRMIFFRSAGSAFRFGEWERDEAGHLETSSLVVHEETGLGSAW